MKKLLLFLVILEHRNFKNFGAGLGRLREIIWFPSRGDSERRTRWCEFFWNIRGAIVPMKVITLGIILFTMAGPACGQELVATTRVLSSIITDITRDKIQVQTLIPSGACPGHFDLNVNHLRVIEKTGVLFAHGFEEYLDDIKQSVRNPEFKVFIIRVERNWLLPASQKELYIKTTKILSDIFPQYADYLEKNRKRIEKDIDRTDREITKMINEKKLYGVRVVCNNHIKDVLEYMGLTVVTTYGRKEELTPSTVKNLIKTCKKENVLLVVDNLQAGPDTGKLISEELKIPHVEISNFPDIFPKTPTMRETLYENTRRIIAVYEKSKNQTH